MRSLWRSACAGGWKNVEEWSDCHVLAKEGLQVKGNHSEHGRPQNPPSPNWAAVKELNLSYHDRDM